MADQPHRAVPQYSPDGRWWWDGQRWIPVRQPTPIAQPALPVDREPEIASQAAAEEARRAPIQLGGAADRRFERRLTTVRRIARYLLLANVLAWVFVITLDSFSRPSTSVPDLVFKVLGYTFPILALLSLVRVVTGRVSREVTIDVDPERLFALLADPYAWSRLGGTWLGRCRRIDAVESAASGGMKGRATLTALGLPGTMRWEMLVYEPPRRVMTFARTSWIGIPTLNLASWSLTPIDDNRTRVRFEQEHRNLGLVLAGALTGRMLGWAADQMLARLKKEAEGLP